MDLQGGDVIWGNSTHAPDDIDGADHSHGELIAFRAKLNDTAVQNMTADNAGTWILEHTPTTFQVLFVLQGTRSAKLTSNRKCWPQTFRMVLRRTRRN